MQTILSSLISSNDFFFLEIIELWTGCGICGTWRAWEWAGTQLWTFLCFGDCTFLYNLVNKANLMHNLFFSIFLVYLSICTCFGRLCACHQEKELYLCDNWYVLFCMDDCLVYRVHGCVFLLRCVLEFRCSWVGVVSVWQVEACHTDTTPTTHTEQHTSKQEHTTNVMIQ